MSLQSVFEEIRPLLTDWIDAETLKALIARLADEEDPQVMLYGFYNAGKSTLLNALLGCEQAAMGDVPTTAEIAEYRWKAWRVLDTPGIDAPIEHEAIAGEALMQSDMVVFVVASDGAVEDARTWRELADIHRRGRGLVLVVNNKSGLAPGHPDFLRLAGVLRQRLCDALGDEAAMATPVALVNAKSALKARLEGKPRLLERSGLPDLERRMEEYLRRSARHQAIQARLRDILALLDQALDRVIEAMADEDVKVWRDLAHRLDIEEDRARLELRGALDEAMAEMEARLLEVDDPERLQDAFEWQAQRSLDRLSRCLQDIFAKDGEWHVLADQVRERVALEIETGSAAVAPQAAEGTPAPARWETEMEQGLDDLVRNGIRSITPEALKEATEALLWQLKEWFPELLRGKGKVILGRWAEQVARYAAPLVQVATTAWDIYQARREEERERQALLQRQAAIRDAVHRSVIALREKLAHQAEAILTRMFRSLREQITERIRHHEQRHGQLAECRQRLETARRQATEAIP